MARPKRPDNRRSDALRSIVITPNFVGTADGSCLIELGQTRVICTASVDAGAPKWRDEGLGWVTAEYGMLPASTGSRKRRPIAKPDSRATEIQRLIGRVLRSVVNFERLGDNTITLDCDVLEADGGTRTAAITGAYVALALAVDSLRQAGKCKAGVLTGAVAATSVGMLDGEARLDLCYLEDSAADVDMNVAMTRDGKFVEVQGSSEGEPFDQDQLSAMLALARKGIGQLIRAQGRAIRDGKAAGNAKE